MERGSEWTCCCCPLLPTVQAVAVTVARWVLGSTFGIFFGYCWELEGSCKYLQVLVGYESLQVLLGTCGICFNFRVTSLHLAAAATATSLYCFHLSNIVGQVKEVDRVKEVSYKL